MDPWEFEVYPYKTMGRGVLEIETDNAIVANGHREAGSGLAKGTFPSYGMWFNQYEFTYGFTDRIEAAGYLNLAKPNGHGLTYAGSKFRVRGDFSMKMSCRSILAGILRSSIRRPRNSMTQHWNSKCVFPCKKTSDPFPSCSIRFLKSL